MKKQIEKLTKNLDNIHPLLVIIIYFTIILVVSIICKMFDIQLPLGSHMVWFNTGNVPFHDVFYSVLLIFSILYCICLIIALIIFIIDNQMNKRLGE